MSIINLNLYINILILISSFSNSFSKKNIMNLNGKEVDKEIKKASQSNYKLFIVFYLKKCQYCDIVLKTLKTQIIKNFEDEDEISFGTINLSNQNNVWLGLRFNVTRIPYIILIENNKIYKFQKTFEEKEVIQFINEEKNIEDAFDIPKEITLFSKLKAALNELSSKIERFLEMYGVNKKWSKIISYLSIIFVITSFIYLESKLIDSCKNSCKKKNVNESIKEEKNENKKDDKEKIKKE